MSNQFSLFYDREKKHFPLLNDFSMIFFRNLHNVNELNGIVEDGEEEEREKVG